MPRVSGYRTRSGKRVRGYTRSGGVSLGRLRHSKPKDPMMIAHGRGYARGKNLNLVRASTPATGTLLHSLVGTPGHYATLHYKGRFGRRKKVSTQIISYGRGKHGITYSVEAQRSASSQRKYRYAGGGSGRYFDVPHFSGALTRYRHGN